MKADYHCGFITYDFNSDSDINNDIVFVAVHPTTHLEFVPRNDVGADLLSVQLARKMGCKTIMTTMPRNHEFGMDLNRLQPTKELAIKMFNEFMSDSFEKTESYENRYAWTASSKEDHENKKKIYKDFWSTVKKMCSNETLLILVHVQDSELRNFPSIMDIVPIYGFKEASIRKTIDSLNKKYSRLFGSLRGDFINFMMSYHRHQYRAGAIQRFDSTNPKEFSGSLKIKHKKTLKRILELGFKKEHSQLRDNYSFEKHARVIENMGTNIPPKITYMTNFTGKLALGTKKELKGRNVMEVEVSSFLSEVNTDIGIEILKEFVESLD